MTIVERLEYLDQNITGSLIVLGGMSKYLNGFRNTQPSGLIDISIKSESTSSIEQLGTRCNILGGTSFSDPVKEQFILVTEDYKFDVFVQDESTPTNVVGSLNVLTPQGDLNWHLNMSSSIQSEYLHNKVQSLKELYGL
jgi:hypothetical protein